jgi:hypothetical protein
MKTPTSKTLEVSAPDKANSTLLSVGFLPQYDLTDTEKELLFDIGDVAGSYIAAHLHQRRSAQVNANYRVAI